MEIIRKAVAFNTKSNALYYKNTDRPHYWKVYQGFVDEAVLPAKDVIHLGCGPLWFGKVATVPLDGKTIYAVDPDAEALARNPAPQHVCAFGESVPLPDGCADVIAADHLLEHLKEPEAVLREAHRLLRPGGRFVFTAPNLLSYSGLATHLTPQWFHDFYVGQLRASNGSANAKPYKTYFRMNTVWAVPRIAKATGFRVDKLYTGVDHPTYTVFFPGIHQAAVALHLLLAKVEALAPFRITLTGSLVRE
ncbi:class I SAM-dependent methyltransferase [Sorangium sp. So ce1000]|uniref:class I SAM-dependent methyltransferase n=1 Tax=Sorangium sp. So ce1000 TaxID=3133325 RepID=UPI003F5D7C8B